MAAMEGTRNQLSVGDTLTHLETNAVFTITYVAPDGHYMVKLVDTPPATPPRGKAEGEPVVDGSRAEESPVEEKLPAVEQSLAAEEPVSTPGAAAARSSNSETKRMYTYDFAAKAMRQDRLKETWTVADELIPAMEALGWKSEAKHKITTVREALDRREDLFKGPHSLGPGKYRLYKPGEPMESPVRKTPTNSREDRIKINKGKHLHEVAEQVMKESHEKEWWTTTELISAMKHANYVFLESKDRSISIVTQMDMRLDLFDKISSNKKPRVQYRLKKQ